MTDKPSKDDAPDDDAFARTLRNLASMPHKPHVPVKPKKEKGS